MYRDKKYDLDFKNPNSDASQWLSGDALCDMYLEWVKEFPITSIEDPFDQDDWAAWTKITASTPIQVILIIRIQNEVFLFKK
jgi:enolase